MIYSLQTLRQILSAPLGNKLANTPIPKKLEFLWRVYLIPSAIFMCISIAKYAFTVSREGRDAAVMAAVIFGFHFCAQLSFSTPERMMGLDNRKFQTTTFLRAHLFTIMPVITACCLCTGMYRSYGIVTAYLTVAYYAALLPHIWNTIAVEVRAAFQLLSFHDRAMLLQSLWGRVMYKILAKTA